MLYGAMISEQAVSARGHVYPRGDVVEDVSRQLVQHGVQEAQGALSSVQSGGIGKRDHGRKHGGAGRRAAADNDGATDNDRVAVVNIERENKTGSGRRGETFRRQQ